MLEYCGFDILRHSEAKDNAREAEPNSCISLGGESYLCPWRIFFQKVRRSGRYKQCVVSLGKTGPCMHLALVTAPLELLFGRE